MTDPINLTQLRADYEGWTDIVEIEVDTALALIDTAEAAHDLVEAAESLAIYPEGAVGLENLADAEQKTRAALARFTLEQP